MKKRLSQLVLKGQQCGILLIIAIQRTDEEFIKTSLRDNFMFRMSVVLGGEFAREVYNQQVER